MRARHRIAKDDHAFKRHFKKHIYIHPFSPQSVYYGEYAKIADVTVRNSKYDRQMIPSSSDHQTVFFFKLCSIIYPSQNVI